MTGNGLGLAVHTHGGTQAHTRQGTHVDAMYDNELSEGKKITISTKHLSIYLSTYFFASG